MPNHETNNVVVIGDPEKIKKFLAEAFVQPGALFDEEENDTNDHDFPVLVFDLIVPQPENIETGGCSGEHEPGVICWYRWNVDNWGTKWGAYSHSYFEHQNLVERADPDLRGHPGEVGGHCARRHPGRWRLPGRGVRRSVRSRCDPQDRHPRVRLLGHGRTRPQLTIHLYVSP